MKQQLATTSGRNHFVAFCLFGFLLVSIPAASGQEQDQVPQPLSLEGAVAMANSKHPTVQGARAEASGAKAGVAAARSALFPTITLAETITDSNDPVFAFGTRLRQGRFTAGDFALANLNYPSAISDFSSTASASWTIFDSSRNLNRLRAAHDLETAATQEVSAAQQNVSFGAVRAYYRALLADQELTATSAAVTRAEEFSHQAHDRVKTGMALEADGMQADIELSRRKQETAEAVSNVALAYEELSIAIGSTVGRYKLTPPVGTPDTEATPLDTLQKKAQAARPDLASLRLRMEGQEHNVKAARDAYGPQISTFANVQADNPHLFGGGSNNWMVGAKADWSVFDGGARKAGVEAAAAKQAEARAAYQQTTRNVELEVSNAFYARRNAEQEYGVANATLGKAQETLRTTVDRYNAGLVNILDVFAQQDQLRFVELSRVQSLYRWWIADTQMKLATGEMSTPGTEQNQ